jgi:RimJ/RimL family protein N-acetyltransferase
MALRLRPVRRADLDTLERWWNDPEAQGYHNWFGFSADGLLRRRFEQDGLLGEDRGNLLVELDDGTLAGDVSYHAVHGVLRHAQFRDGGFHDMVLYSRLRDD